MIDPNRLTILRRNGYTEREARFLCLAADVGGYFLRRHFNQFLGTKRGRPEAALAAKLVEKRHAKLYLSNGGIELYHLSRRWFYHAIGSPDCRNRRRRAPGPMHARLLTLDFVLAHPDRSYLLSDPYKTRYLVGERSLPRHILPAAKGRWIDRFPLYTAEETTGGWPLVAVCYVDPRVFSERRFGSFLERHARLWERLGAFRVSYVTDQRWNGRAAEAAFERFTEIHWPSTVRDRPSIRERILKAFRLEKLFRSRHIYRLRGDDERLILEIRQRLTPPRYDSLYSIWSQTSDRSVYDLVAPDPHEQWPRGDLDVHLVRRNCLWLYPA